MWWAAPWNLQARGPKWLPEIIRLTWYLQIINLVFSIHGTIDSDLAGPFFYSRTSCCGHSGTPATLDPKFDVVWKDWPHLGPHGQVGDTLKHYGINVSLELGRIVALY